MLDLKRMMLLCDLADLGTVTAVADRRNITSSAVSQQLRVLEDESGAVLFRRDGRTLGLTRSGRVLADHARRVLGAVDEAMSAVAATENRASGQLVVAAFNMAVTQLVTPMVRQLGVEAPEMRVEVYQQSPERALRQLRQGEIDLAITCSYDFTGQEPYSGLSVIGLIDEPLVLMAPPDLHALIRSGGLAALADHPWVSGPTGSGLDTVLMRAGERAGFRPHVKHRLNGAHNVCDVAATGIGPAVVPLLTVPAALQGHIVDGIELERRDINAVVRAGRQHDPKTAVALNALQSIADEIVPEPATSVVAAS
ncbi:LysR family transcriptional regulator [Gordonia sp. ABSL1-1]|uniref:LysR family transcriptional regulator n=1 Tax=Gordonia sp. ABSL1-1 TaxID=3053923 RepID=UPI00257361DE|nr:LysR family transcriptional regulator [Gordonia sp. ABSL1-1]MDL9937808.1 LysR family transcriptional regulator [Gordonia sp. ABSL1-1]